MVRCRRHACSRINIEVRTGVYGRRIDRASKSGPAISVQAEVFLKHRDTERTEKRGRHLLCASVLKSTGVGDPTEQVEGDLTR